jgi:ATP-dependent RNA helicase DDX52/ROK1
MDVDEEDEETHAPAQEEAKKSTTVHRVSTKGNDIPPHIDSFEDLKNVASFPSHLFANLKSSGYAEPTSIQAYGIPILLKVSALRWHGCLILIVI